MSELLSSDALENQYGPIALEVLQQDEGGRIICNKVVETGQILELSQVVFRPEGVKAFAHIHRKIIEGNPIGKAFADAGMVTDRRVRTSHRYDYRTLPGIFTQRFGAGEPPTVIDLAFVVEPEGIPYADILEVFSPDVKYWKNLTGGEVSQEMADRLEIFGAELEALDDSA